MISNEDFGVLVEELLGREQISYDMLCLLAERELRPLVRRLCRSEPCLRGKDLENDIMQEINIRLIKTAISHFLLREGCDSQINYDPIGFRKWMVTVAINIKNDYANRERRHDFKNLPIDENVLSGEYDEISISVHVDAYVCGNGETIRASPDEVAEISARTESEPDFLSEQCDWVGETDFEIRLSPDEPYFNEDFKM